MRRVIILFVITVLAVGLSAGVAVAAVGFGTQGRDFFRGTNGPDVFYGRGGSDVVLGRASGDILYGGEGNDFVGGGSGTIDGNVRFDRRGIVVRVIPDGKDTLYGGSGGDWLFAGSGNDVTYGGSGNDTLGLFFFEFIFDTGNDVFYGGSGSDEIWSFDGDLTRPSRDLVFCGNGRDEVLADRLDRVAGDCERVRRF